MKSTAHAIAPQRSARFAMLLLGAVMLASLSACAGPGIQFASLDYGVSAKPAPANSFGHIANPDGLLAIY
jgi:hypothetical protein